MKVKRIFTYKKKKVVTKDFTKHNLAEWFDHFYKQKSKTLNVDFRKVFFDFKLKHPFLDESQVNGKVYTFLGIPNILGNIDKKKFRKLVTLEKKANKNRLNVRSLSIKKTKPIKAIKAVQKNKFFTLNKPSEIYKVEKKEENYDSNSWFDDIYMSSYRSPPELKKSPSIEIRLSRLNHEDYEPPKKTSEKRYFSSVCKWSSFKSPETEEKPQNSPKFMKTNDEIEIRSSPSWSEYRHRPLATNLPQNDNAKEAIETPNSSPFSCWSLSKLSPRMFDIHASDNYKRTETDINETKNIEVSHELDEIISSSSFNDYDTGIMSLEYDPEMYAHEDKSKSPNLSPPATSRVSKSRTTFDSQGDTRELEIRSTSSIEYDPAMYTAPEDIKENESISSDGNLATSINNILISETDLEISLFSKNAPAEDDLIFEGRLIMDQNKTMVANQYMSSNKASWSKTLEHFEKKLNTDIEVVPQGIFGYLKNQNDEPVIKPVSLREIMSVSEEKSVKYQDLLDDTPSDIIGSSPTQYKTRPHMVSDSDNYFSDECDSSSLEYKSWATDIYSD